MRRARGFTLIEALVATVIAAIAATAIFSHLRGLMQRAEREQAHQLAALRVMNDGMRLAHGGALEAAAPREEGDHLVFEPLSGARDPAPPVEVRNFSVTGDALPAIGLAYTPFQVFSVAREGYRLNMLARGLPPPAGAAPLSAETLAPGMVQPGAETKEPAPR